MSPELPLADTAGQRLQLWAVAALVSLGVIAVALALVADRRLRELARVPVTVTVAIAGVDGREAVEAAAARLERLPGVAFVEPLSRRELEDLVEPWVGEGVELLPPMPQLFDVTFNPGIHPAADTLGPKIEELLPGASVSVPPPPRSEGLRALRNLAAAVAGLALLGLVVVAFHLARTHAGLDRDAVALLHQIGACERYLRRQLEAVFVGCSLRGALLGYVAGVILLALAQTALRVMTTAATEFQLRPFDWIAVTGFAVLALLASLPALRAGVRRSLARLL